MPVRWTQDLATGNAEIDGQHKEIFNRLNKLLTASEEGRGSLAVAEMLDFLEDYVKTHFAAEEHLQKRLGYPEYTAHKGLHLKFLVDVARLKDDYAQKGETLTMTLEVNQVVVEWLVNHIKTVDRRLADYAKGKSGGR